jgi:hypothetical protein
MRGSVAVPVTSWLRQACAAFVARWRARFEGIVDAMFGFELRDDEVKELTRRRPKRSRDKRL